MTGLRERQKAGRRQGIMDAARQSFREKGYGSTTIESIAAEANISAMTVFNYYGSKGGILLALVDECDHQMMKKLEKVFRLEIDNPAEYFSAFINLSIDHALSHLDRDIWRHAVAASIAESDSEFGRGYIGLDEELNKFLVRLIGHLKDQKKLKARLDTEAAAQLVYAVQNRVIRDLITKPSLSRKKAKDSGLHLLNVMMKEW